GGLGPSYSIAPKSFRPCVAITGTQSSLMSEVVGLRLKSSQWLKVPPGASGSSTTRARLRALSGTPSICIGGILFSPYIVYLFGIFPPSVNPLLVSFINSFHFWKTLHGSTFRGPLPPDKNYLPR